MAKPTKQQPSINELGGLPPEFAADTEQDKSEDKAPVESDAQEKATENLRGSDHPDDDSNDSNDSDDSDDLDVVVEKGQTLRHSGTTYTEDSLLSLPYGDAERLINLGVVADARALRQQAASAINPSVTVDDGVKINRGS